jgi:hypothetical protein
VAEVVAEVWFFGPEAFFAAMAVFLARAAALAGRTIIVPQDVLEAVVLELTWRVHCWRVAGLDVDVVATFFAAAVVADFAAPFFVCDAALVFRVGEILRAAAAAPLVARARAYSTIPARLVVAALIGLEDFREEAEQAMCDCCCWSFVGKLRSGDCGNVLELEDLGERILDSARWDTMREGPPAALGFVRFFGLESGGSISPTQGRFSLSEERRASLIAVRNQRRKLTYA